MKKEFLAPELDVQKFAMIDIVNASSPFTPDENETPWEDDT